MASLLGKVRRAWRLARYDDYSIAKLFRSQGAQIGQRTRLLVRDLGSEPYLVSIGDETLVSSGVVFSTHDGAVWVLRDDEPQLNRFGRIEIGTRCFVGARSILLPGAKIGDRTVIGAGSVVSGEIPGGVVAAGVPARVIGTVDDWARKVRAESLDLPCEVFPLDHGDRSLLRSELERLVPPAGERAR